MKYIISVAATVTLLFGTLAIAGNPPKLQPKTKHEDQAKTFKPKLSHQKSWNHFKISLQFITLNKVLESPDRMSIGTKLEFTYYFTSRFYNKANVVFYHHGKIGFGDKFGYQYPIGKFEPYVELGFARKFSGNKYKYAPDYDVGLKYKLIHWLSPFVEFDKFATPDHEAVKLGTGINLTQRFSVTVDYIKALTSRGSGAELKFNYAF